MLEIAYEFPLRVQHLPHSEAFEERGRYHVRQIDPDQVMHIHERLRAVFHTEPAAPQLFEVQNVESRREFAFEVGF